MNAFQMKELRGVVAGALVKARATPNASAPIMGANATASRRTVMVPARRI